MTLERKSHSPSSWSKGEGDERKRERRSPSSHRRSSRGRHSRSPEPRRSRFSRQSESRGASRSESRRRSSRRDRGEKSLDSEGERREHSDRSRGRRADSRRATIDRSDDKDEPSGGNWWEHQPPYATRRAGRGRGRGGPWGNESGRPITDVNNDFRETTEGLEATIISRPHPQSVRPFPPEDGPYGRRDPILPGGVPAMRPGWVQSGTFGPGWRGYPRVDAPPPPPPTSAEMGESDETLTIQLRPRQDDSGVRLSPAEDDWDNERKLRAPLMPGSVRGPGYGGLPRPMLPPGMWQQQMIPHRFGAPVDAALLARQRPPLLQQRLPPGVSPLGPFGAVGRARRGRMVGGIPLPSHGPMMMLQQAAARRRIEAATDGRYLDAELETPGAAGQLNTQMSPQDRQEEELVEELQGFLDLELSRGIKSHSFFTRVADKLHEPLLTTHTRAHISSVIQGEGSVSFGTWTDEEPAPSTLFSEDLTFIVKRFVPKRRLKSLQVEIDNGKRASKKRRQGIKEVADFFPNVILSPGLAEGIRDMPFNLLKEASALELKEDDKPRQKARLRQLIAAKRTSDSFGRGCHILGPDSWVVSCIGTYPFSAYFPSSQCPTYPSLKEERLESFLPTDSRLPLNAECATFNVSNPFVSFPTSTGGYEPPSCLSSAFACRFSSQQAPQSSPPRIVTNLLVERTLVSLISGI